MNIKSEIPRTNESKSKDYSTEHTKRWHLLSFSTKAFFNDAPELLLPLVAIAMKLFVFIMLFAGFYHITNVFSLKLHEHTPLESAFFMVILWGVADHIGQVIVNLMERDRIIRG